jgi:parallel beta-helix repeat protein
MIHDDTSPHEPFPIRTVEDIRSLESSLFASFEPAQRRGPGRPGAPVHPHGDEPPQLRNRLATAGDHRFQQPAWCQYQGNDIGLKANGKTVAGNGGDGLRINASSQGDLIGSSEPVSGVTYYNADSLSIQPVSGWQGISGSEPGVYTLSANVIEPGSSTPIQAELATVERNPDGSFGTASWININDPGSSGLCTADSVAGNQLVGIAKVGSGIISYQATVNNGRLVSGGSSNTQVGGVIPLGNVISGNKQNGIAVTGTASGFTSFNTFAGIYAFAGAAPNKKDGILVTSTGGNNLIRTCIVSGNGGNGIEIGGHATGVQVTDTAVGTDTSIQTAIPNGGDGIQIDGHAHGNDIGGFQPSVEPQVTVSANDKYGIAVAGSAHDNAIFHTYIGTNALATGALGNTLGGISIGSGTSDTTVGGSSLPLQDKIEFNIGPGVTIQSSQDNVVLGNEIQSGAQYGVYVTGVGTGTQVENNSISGNASDGVRLVKARKVTIGGNASGAGSQVIAGPGNRIVTNQGYGLYARGNCNGSVVQGNTILANAQGNVNLTNSRGITYTS